MEEEIQRVIDMAAGSAKVFSGEPMTDRELEAVKEFFTGRSSLPDLSENEKQRINGSTHEDIIANIQLAFENTVYRSFETRCGIYINREE